MPLIARFLIFGMLLVLSACTETDGPSMDPGEKTAIAGTVAAQAIAFQLAGDPADIIHTQIFCANCELVDVVRVIDGDTLDTNIGRVQLFGADAPASGEPCSAEATKFTRSIVSRQVRLRFGPPLHDEFKTHQAYVFDSSGNSLDYQLIAGGFARARTRDREQLDGRYEDEFVLLERSSLNSAAGCLWEDFVAPATEPTLTPTVDFQASLDATATVSVELTAFVQSVTRSPEPAELPVASSTAAPAASATAAAPTATSAPQAPTVGMPTAIPEKLPPTAPPEPAPTPTSLPTATTVPTPTSVPTATAVPTPTSVPTATAVPTATITPTPRPPTPTPTVTPVPVPRISITTGPTPIGTRFGAIFLNGARVNFNEPVGEISVRVRWGDSKFFVEVTVNQATGVISAAHNYGTFGVFLVEIVATTDEGDSASASINALVN